MVDPTPMNKWDLPTPFPQPPPPHVCAQRMQSPCSKSKRTAAEGSSDPHTWSRPCPCTPPHRRWSHGGTAIPGSDPAPGPCTAPRPPLGQTDSSTLAEACVHPCPQPPAPTNTHKNPTAGGAVVREHGVVQGASTSARHFCSGDLNM